MCLQQGSSCHVTPKILRVLFGRVTLYDLNNLWERGGQYALGTYTCVREAFEHVIGGGSVTFMAPAVSPLSLLAADADLAAAPRPHGDSAVYPGLKDFFKSFT